MQEHPGRWVLLKPMSKTDCSTQEGIAESRIAGPFAGYDQYGRFDHHYWLCTDCGTDSVSREDLDECCR